MGKFNFSDTENRAGVKPLGKLGNCLPQWFSPHWSFHVPEQHQDFRLMAWGDHLRPFTSPLQTQHLPVSERTLGRFPHTLPWPNKHWNTTEKMWDLSQLTKSHSFSLRKEQERAKVRAKGPAKVRSLLKKFFRSKVTSDRSNGGGQRKCLTNCWRGKFTPTLTWGSV